MQERLSILAMTRYRDDIWEYFRVPNGVPRQDAIDSILMECAELGLVYTEPETLKQQISLWSAKELPGWKRMYRALAEDYNPIYNFDRYEDWQDDNSGSSSGSSSGTDTMKVAGFNQSTGLATRDERTGSNSQSAQSSGSSTHKGHLYGNIGTVTSGKMVQEELELRQHNMIDIIVNSFKNNLCVQVY